MLNAPYITKTSNEQKTFAYDLILRARCLSTRNRYQECVANQNFLPQHLDDITHAQTMNDLRYSRTNT